MFLWAHHTKTYLGIEIDINGHEFPDGMVDHVLAFAAFLVMLYGLYALVRDLWRWRRRRAEARLTART